MTIVYDSDEYLDNFASGGGCRKGRLLNSFQKLGLSGKGMSGEVCADIHSRAR